MAGRGSSGSSAIALRGATIGWSTGNLRTSTEPETVDHQHDFTLNDMNVTIPQGGLTLVSGSLGCGKSLFVSTPSIPIGTLL